MPSVDVLGHFVELVGAKGVRVRQAEAVDRAAVERLIALRRRDHGRHRPELLQRFGVEAGNAHLHALHVIDAGDALVAHELVGRQEGRAEVLHVPALGHLLDDRRMVEHGLVHLGVVGEAGRREERQFQHRGQRQLAGIVADAKHAAFVAAGLDRFRHLPFRAERGAVIDLDLEIAVRLLLEKRSHGFEPGGHRARRTEHVVVPNDLLLGERRRRDNGGDGGGESNRTPAHNDPPPIDA